MTVRRRMEKKPIGRERKRASEQTKRGGRHGGARGKGSQFKSLTLILFREPEEERERGEQ